MSFRKILLSSIFIAGAAVTSANAGHVDLNLDIGPPPPAAIVEPVPVVQPGYVWAPGYWSYQGPNPVWVPGHMIQERPGYHWVPEHWVQQGPRYHFVPGFWEPNAPPPPVYVEPAPVGGSVIIEEGGRRHWR